MVFRGGKQGRWDGHQREEEVAVSVQVGCGGQGEPALGGAASRAWGTGSLKGSAQKGSQTLGEWVRGGLCVSSQFLRDDREGRWRVQSHRNHRLCSPGNMWTFWAPFSVSENQTCLCQAENRKEVIWELGGDTAGTRGGLCMRTGTWQMGTWVCVCTCVCMCDYVFACECVCICVYIVEHVCMHVHAREHMRTRVHAQICMCGHVCSCAYMYECAYGDACEHVRTVHVYGRVHVNACAYVSVYACTHT